MYNLQTNQNIMGLPKNRLQSYQVVYHDDVEWDVDMDSMLLVSNRPDIVLVIREEGIV